MIKIDLGKNIAMKTTIQLFLLYLLFFLTPQESIAQDVYKLWDGQKKPYYKENNLKEYKKEAFGTMCVYDVIEPTLTVYKSVEPNSGKSVIIIPGGGYELVAIYHEGHDIAKVLAKQGITAAVLKYRLPNPVTSDQPDLVPLTDTRRALKLLKKNAVKYGINKEKVGLMGFSAGSHLATVTSLWKSEDKDENPYFSALIYGVTNLTGANKKWLEESLYHRKMTKDEIIQNRLLDLVSSETPPAFIVHAFDDTVCNVKESTLYAQKLFEHQVSVEMHLFPKGGHGFGIGHKEDGTDQWLKLFVNWLNSNIF